MHELIKVGENTYYMEGYSRVGIFQYEKNSVCAVDGGSDDNAARALLNHLSGHDWQLKMIINTHSHADHTGGNTFLRRETGCRIFASGAEKAFISNQILSPAFIFGGNPINDLRCPAFVAENSGAEDLSEAVLPDGLSIIPLGGHSISHIGLKTADDVCFFGDALTCCEMLRKPYLPPLYDVEETLSSFDLLESMEGVRFIPSHEPIPEEFSETIKLNRDKVLETIDLVLSICGEPCSLETLTRRFYESCGIKINLINYVLAVNTLKAYLTYLNGKNEVEYFFEDNSMLWRSVKK